MFAHRVDHLALPPKLGPHALIDLVRKRHGVDVIYGIHSDVVQVGTTLLIRDCVLLDGGLEEVANFLEGNLDGGARIGTTCMSDME
eukprot:CAMPEP_0181087690 /NCGR_PEP_ID=MMETSP1071-20121207/6403_1 /TAXON_ID=35127 /ORGANISM="Thalassiosira sp., Strain NH16" /LENGTH=85 /DNA_ID=CAMNT_0023169587 /DNA_START=387 /DNA_END=644 /DNA_ORIENTATION=+